MSKIASNILASNKISSLIVEASLLENQEASYLHEQLFETLFQFFQSYDETTLNNIHDLIITK